MTEFMTRREMREAERRGLKPTPVAEVLVQPVVQVAANEVEQVIEPAAQAAPQVFLSRREMREAERKGIRPAEPVAEIAPVIPQLPEVEIPDLEAASEEIEQIVVTDVSTLDLPPADFTGNNLFAEPSTQSIVLDVAPEAIALPIETGEIAVTGSIAVLTEPTTGSITGGLDGIDLDNADRQDAVTGVISIVEPVSALDVINARVNVGVVPKSVLRKGWWRPWVIAIASILMAVAAIIATVTILNALGA
jgi:hypothetical protein